MIYFAQLETGSIKIGTSKNVGQRMASLETHYGCSVGLLATMPGGRDQEQAIHAMFSEHRLGRTEQFRPVKEILEFIGLPIIAHANPDAVAVQEPVVKPIIVAIRGSAEFKEWIERYAHRNRVSVASAVERALAIAAEIDKFEAPPPR